MASPEELAELTGEQLVALITERAHETDPLTARKFLAVIRGEIPEGTIF